MNQTLKFLGRGSSYNSKEVNNSAYFKKNGVLVLIDCGEGVFNALKSSNALKGVKAVYQIITHMHDDHIEDISQFFSYCNKELGIKPKLINCVSIDAKKLDEKGAKEGRDYIMVEPLVENFKFVNFLLVPHCKRMDSCALELFLDDKKIFYSGDCNNIPFAIEGYDEYYFDCADQKNTYHMDINRIKKIAKKNKIKNQQIFLMHIQSAEVLRIAQENRIRVVETEAMKQKEKITAKVNDR